MDALEEVDEYFVARDNIFHCLSRALCTHDNRHESGHTPRSTPIPVKIVFVGGITYRKGVTAL